MDCEQAVQSHKRGLCANELSAEDFRAIAPGVSWFYNWHFQPKEAPPKDVPVEFVPMVWSNDAARLEGLTAYLAGHKARAVLALNEPNLKGQAFITPEESAKSYVAIKVVADPYGIPVIGPHMALGSAAKDSITAEDPIDKKKVTYTFMVPFLKAFLFYADKTEVHATAFHSYGNIDEMRWAVGMMAKDFARPVWVTEYAQWSAPNAEASRKYLIQATDMMERNPSVEGYAWFKERVKDNSKISLFERTPGKLTPLGEAYVNLPVHDADVYYRLPGKLQAERYVQLDKMEIFPTSDSDGFCHMAMTGASGELIYNVQVDRAGVYSIGLRVGEGAGSVQIGAAPAVVVEKKGWQTVETALQLVAGAQQLHVKLQGKGVAVNWIEFKGK